MKAWPELEEIGFNAEFGGVLVPINCGYSILDFPDLSSFESTEQRHFFANNIKGEDGFAALIAKALWGNPSRFRDVSAEDREFYCQLAMLLTSVDDTQADQIFRTINAFQAKVRSELKLKQTSTTSTPKEQNRVYR